MSESKGIREVAGHLTAGQLSFKRNIELRNLVRQKVEDATKTLKKQIPRQILDKCFNRIFTNPPMAHLLLGMRHPERFCQRCGKCCVECDPIALDEDDIVALEHIRPNVHQHLKAVMFNDGPSLAIRHSKPCEFLKNRLCTIYGVRPKVCREFPIRVGPEGVIIVHGLEWGCRYVVNWYAEAIVLESFREMAMKDKGMKRVVDELAQMGERFGDSLEGLDFDYQLSQMIHHDNRLENEIWSIIGSKNESAKGSGVNEQLS